MKALTETRNQRINRLRRAREAAQLEAVEPTGISADLLKVLLANKDSLLCVAVGGQIIYQRPGALKSRT